MTMIATILIIWILLSILYIDKGINFISKIKNPFKVCLFAILLGPGFWVVMILIGIIYVMMIVMDYVSKFTSPIYNTIRQWWLK